MAKLKKYMQKIISILLLVNRKTKTDIIQYTLFVHYKKKKREKQPYACFLDGNLTDRLSCCNSHFPFSKLKHHMKLVWHNFTHVTLNNINVGEKNTIIMCWMCWKATVFSTATAWFYLHKTWNQKCPVY